jgi:cytosolic carboxypeptidase protein 2/3
MLRGSYLIKVVPMLNPDGVTAGNYRFSGFGCDLNRKWRNCKESQQPEIYYMRELIRNLNRERKVIMYIDMHGHSRKKHVFFYGCCEKGEDASATARPKQFPFLMERLHDAYKYENCCFNVQKDKEGTARVTVWKDLKIDHVYTL